MPHKKPDKPSKPKKPVAKRKKTVKEVVKKVKKGKDAWRGFNAMKGHNPDRRDVRMLPPVNYAAKRGRHPVTSYPMYRDYPRYGIDPPGHFVNYTLGPKRTTEAQRERVTKRMYFQ